MSIIAGSKRNARKKEKNKKSYKNVRARARKQESLETLSETARDDCICHVERKDVPFIGAGNWERPFADCRERTGRYY